MAKFGFDYNSGQAIGIRGTSQGVRSTSAGADLIKNIRAGGNFTTKKK